MAKAKRLKVFRTPIGFHDAYVAAPSQKAALEAWGADSNLFARSEAEEVTEPEMMKEPLERPGEVIRRLRGTHAEQIAAADKAERRGRAPRSPPPGNRSSKPAKPSSADVDEAQEALAELEKRQRAELRAIDRDMERLERRRRELHRRHEAEHDRLAAERDRKRAAHERAVRNWEKL